MGGQRLNCFEKRSVFAFFNAATADAATAAVDFAVATD